MTNTPDAPVAWRVKDYADGWILFTDEARARHEVEVTGALIEPLYSHPPQSSAEAYRAGATDMRERAALAAETPDRRGRDFVPESLWDNIKRETATAIRALPVE